MKRTFYLCGVAVILLAGVAVAQSVADAARQTRKQNANKPAAKVFTNDDLPTHAPISVTGQAPAGNEDSAKPADGEDAASAGNPDKADGEKAKSDADKDKPKTDEDKKTFAEKRDAAIQQWKQRF